VAAVAADPATGEPSDELVDRDIDRDGSIDTGAALGQRDVERGRLAGRPRKAVEDRAAVRVGLGEAVEEDPDDRLVGHEAAIAHRGVDLATELGPGGDDRPQQIAGGQNGHSEVPRQDRRLRPLPGPGRTKQHDHHGWASLSE
jgi:hypothetical protein